MAINDLGAASPGCPCFLALGWGSAAGHNADVCAAAPGGDGGNLGDSVAVAQHVHAVDGFDKGGLVA